MAAAAVLRNAGHRVHLVIGRRRNQLSPDLPSSSASGIDLFSATATRPEGTTPSSSRDSESSPAMDDSVYGKNINCMFLQNLLLVSLSFYHVHFV